MRLTIRNKLFLGFGALLALMLTASLLSLANIASISDGTATMHEDVLPNVEMLGTLKSDALSFRNEQAKHVGETDPAALEQIQANLAAYKETMAGNFAKLKSGRRGCGSRRGDRGAVAEVRRRVGDRHRGQPRRRQGQGGPASCSTVGEEFFVPFENEPRRLARGRARGGQRGVTPTPRPPSRPPARPPSCSC